MESENWGTGKYFHDVILKLLPKTNQILQVPAAEVFNWSSLLPSVDTSKNWKFKTPAIEFHFLSNFYTPTHSLKGIQYYNVFSTLNNLKHWISLSSPQKTHLPRSGCLRLILRSDRRTANLCVQWAVEGKKSMSKSKLEIFSLVFVLLPPVFY